MGSKTEIEWTDSTFNPWIGCTKVSAGCDHCYAEALSTRYGWVEWGAHGVRRRTSPANWRKPLAWQKQAKAAGVRRRAFCASLADVFDNRAPDGAREDLWELIRRTPDIDWQLLTKRPQNVPNRLPADWGDGYPNVWLGITAENQEEYDRRWPVLASIPAAVLFVSYEPAVGPLDLGDDPEAVPDWIIWGGESGPRARVMDPDWARQLTRQCQDFYVDVFGKQWGSYRSNPHVFERGLPIAEAKRLDPPTNGKGGALLDGRLWRQFPTAMASYGRKCVGTIAGRQAL